MPLRNFLNRKILYQFEKRMPHIDKTLPYPDITPLNPPDVLATVYTQVIESLPVLELPHPNPPLYKGREPDFFFPPLQGGIKGGNPGNNKHIPGI